MPLPTRSRQKARPLHHRAPGPARPTHRRRPAAQRAAHGLHQRRAASGAAAVRSRRGAPRPAAARARRGAATYSVVSQYVVVLLKAINSAEFSQGARRRHDGLVGQPDCLRLHLAVLRPPHHGHELLEVQVAVAVLVELPEQLLGDLLAHLPRPDLVDVAPSGQHLDDLVLANIAVVVVRVKGLEGGPQHRLLGGGAVPEPGRAELRVVDGPRAVEVEVREHLVDAAERLVVGAVDLKEPLPDLLQRQDAVAVGVHVAEDLVHIGQTAVI
mmetsp:Transcript_54605/g.145013  ORF Transcript_54605/g.145013 Transcript_54605/m.145013 type:complete len:270 (-) Transcript_54605:1039-1848(-)